MNQTTPIPFPPQAMRFMNEDDVRFVEIGDLHLDHALSFCVPGTVFDLGCGYGRLAYALKRRRFAGRYVGMDILPKQIDWLRDNFSDPAFGFRLMDIHNARYNPNGTLTPEQVDFDLPFAPDLTLVLSVFTHLYEADIETYLRKLRAVVHPRSVVMATVFLMAADAARRPYDFAHRLNDHCNYHDETDPLHAIAYDQDWLTDLIRRCGFEIHDLFYGYQDRLALVPA